MSKETYYSVKRDLLYQSRLEGMHVFVEGSRLEGMHVPKETEYRGKRDLQKLTYPDLAGRMEAARRPARILLLI